MERIIIFLVGVILVGTGIYLIVYNIPIEGGFTGRYGNWSDSSVGGTPVIVIGAIIISISVYIGPDKKKE